MFQIPYTEDEITWAHRRPAQHRTPLPSVGDEVCYRHESYGPVVRAEITWVQSLDDLADPHLWQAQEGLVDGRAVLRRRFDPWPLVRLRVPKLGTGETREARLRGSPGWLPLDWEIRYRPAPEFVVIGD